jgi:GNAT superfamily N-acetyltransferase
MNLIIRDAQACDALSLTDLARCAKAHWNYPVEWLELWQEELVITGAYITRHLVLVAELDGEVVGVSALEDGGDDWILEHVWVEPSHHGKGIGKALVEKALALAREIRPGVVAVQSDPHAAGFYRRLGAREGEAVSAPMPGAPERTLPLFQFHMTKKEII